jgi:pilus assembly protein Flp/PilA
MLKSLVKFQARVATRERGATAVEYGIMVALIAAVIVGIVATLGDQIQTAFQEVSDTIAENVGGGGAG